MPRLILLVVVRDVDVGPRRRMGVVMVQPGGQIGVEVTLGTLVTVRQVLLVGQAVIVAVPGGRAGLARQT